MIYWTEAWIIFQEEGFLKSNDCLFLDNWYIYRFQILSFCTSSETQYSASRKGFRTIDCCVYLLIILFKSPLVSQKHKLIEIGNFNYLINTLIFTLHVGSNFLLIGEAQHIIFFVLFFFLFLFFFCLGWMMDWRFKLKTFDFHIMLSYRLS